MEFTFEKRKLVQRAINELTGSRLKADGAIGPASMAAIAEYRKRANIGSGGLDLALWHSLSDHIKARFIQMTDIVHAARDIEVPPSMLLALWDKESAGSGFFVNGRCTILFERHIFYRETVKVHGKSVAEKWRKQEPNICHPSWDSRAYSGGMAEYARLEKARLLDGTIALMSASWGLFQLMGFNWSYTRFRDVQSMVSAFDQSEHEHLAGLIGFIVKQPKLHQALASRDFRGVGRIYNGPAYASHGYHTDLERRSQKFIQYDNL